MIELRALTKAYDGGDTQVVALRDVDLQIERGEMVAIMGRSGSGKSTLLSILGLLDLPTSGQYLLEGVDVTALGDREVSRVRNRHFGFVFQAFHLFPELTALENVEMPLVYAGVNRREGRSRARQALEQVGLGDRFAHYPGQLSGGEQQRVAIARAIVNNPSLLLADEPTGNLPYGQGQAIMELFGEIHRQGVTVLVVTHDPEVARWCKRLVRIDDGRILSDGPATPESVREAVMADLDGRYGEGGYAGRSSAQGGYAGSR